MLNAASAAVVLMTIYGFVGIWTQVIGFHNRWEFWLFQAYLGFFACPWYNYSQTMVRPHFPIIFRSEVDDKIVVTDIRSNSPRKRVPLLLLFRSYWQDFIVLGSIYFQHNY